MLIFGRPNVGNKGFVDFSSLNGDDGFKIQGEATYDECGVSVAGGGDVNKDGYYDLIISAPGENDDEYERPGKVYVVFGTSNIGHIGENAVFLLSSLNGVNGFRLVGDMTSKNGGDYAGAWVSGCKNIHRDDYYNVLIGAIEANSSKVVKTGAGYVVWIEPILNNITGTMLLSSLNGTTGFKLEGENEGDECGFGITNLGDINADGYIDIAIGSPQASLPDGKIAAGIGYVLFGQTDLGKAGVISLASLNGVNGFKLESGFVNDYMGGAISGLGDFNRDGIDDFVIGSYSRIFVTPPQKTGPITTYVIWGNKTIGKNGMIALTGLTNAQGIKLMGEGNSDNNGASVRGAGDINGDGYPDLLLGAGNASPNNRKLAGCSYIVFGGPEAGQIGTWPCPILMEKMDLS